MIGEEEAMSITETEEEPRAAAPDPSLSRLIEEFRRRVDEITDAGEVDTALSTILVDIDRQLGLIERAVATFRGTLADLIGGD
jgi:hypothetical protein